MKIDIYTTPTCSYCRQVKAFLSQRGVQFTERDVSADRTAAEEMARKSGQMGVPVIVIDGQVVVGFNKARLEQLLASIGPDQRPHLGLAVADASKMAQKFSIPPVLGAFVGKVAPASPGARAGIRRGDIIIEVNSHPVRNADDLERTLSRLTAGRRVEIVFRRAQETLRSEVIL